MHRHPEGERDCHECDVPSMFQCLNDQQPKEYQLRYIFWLFAHEQRDRTNRQQQPERNPHQAGKFPSYLRRQPFHNFRSRQNQRLHQPNMQPRSVRIQKRRKNFGGYFP